MLFVVAFYPIRIHIVICMEKSPKTFPVSDSFSVLNDIFFHTNTLTLTYRYTIKSLYALTDINSPNTIHPLI